MGKYKAPPIGNSKSLPDSRKLLSLKPKDTLKTSTVQNYPLTPRDYESLSDLELLTHYRNSPDLRILEYLLNKYERYVASIAIKLLRNMEDVKDVKQELFFKIIKEMNKSQEADKRPDKYFKQWLGRVTKNYIYDKYIRPNHPIATEVLPEKAEETYNKLDLDMDFQEVHNCMQELSLDQRTYLELRFFGDMPNRKISEEMNWAPGKTRSLRDRALAKLRKLLGPRGEELIKYIKED